MTGAIIRQRTGNFDPSTFRNRYQESLQQLIEAKMKGVGIRPTELSAPPPVIDFDGSVETQPCAGSAHTEAEDGEQGEANQGGTGSTSAGVAVAGIRAVAASRRIFQRLR
jgi:non-homologous end joining protein Ku